MADSMEMTILSILSLALHCEWRISRYQQALVTTVSSIIPIFRVRREIGH